MSTQQEAARLKGLFKDVSPVEVTVIVDLQGKLPSEVAQMLPKFTVIEQEESNPAFGLLVDVNSGRIFSLRSGLSPHIKESFDGILFKSGIMSKDMAVAAGGVW